MDERSKELQLKIRKEFLVYNSEAKSYFNSLLDKELIATPEALQRTKDKFDDEYLLWLVFVKKNRSVAPRTYRKAKELKELKDSGKEN